MSHIIRNHILGNGYRVVLVLTHQGLMEEVHWSMKYNYLESKISRIINEDGIIDPAQKWKVKDSVETKYLIWKDFMKDIYGTLCTYDNDFENNGYGLTKLPDFIVISGHYHLGTTIRNIDGIDHIGVPSYWEGDRFSKNFSKNQSYPVMDLVIHPSMNKINIRYQSTTDIGLYAESELYY
jgi:hypothetical protein